VVAQHRAAVVRPYQQQGLAGFEERSRAPHRIPQKTRPEFEQQVPTGRDRRRRPATPSPASGCGASNASLFNPPAHSTCDSDVEAVHGLVEEESYEPERFSGDRTALLGRVSSSPLWFSYLRENSANGHAAPTSSGPSGPLG